MATLFRKLWRYLTFVFPIIAGSASKAPTVKIEDPNQTDSDCDCLPLDIPHEEAIIRALYYHVHLKKNGNLKWQAYQPTPNTDEISVMRGGCMSLSECKKKAKELERPDYKLYRGLAALATRAVRAKNFQVLDSRQEFCGHGHISTGIVDKVSIDEEPVDPEQREQVKAVAQELIRLCSHKIDPAPSSDDWPQSIELRPPVQI